MDQKDRYVLKNEKLTEQKREAVRQKLSIICKKDENIDEILKHADYCMIARGDLGVEIGLENLAYAQLEILDAATKQNVPTVVATEVLKSMLEYTHPSRAEVNDIYHAITNGAKGFILTNETVVGKHPFLAIEWLTKLANSYKKHK